MQRVRPSMIMRKLRLAALAVAVIGSFAATSGPSGAAEEPSAYTVEVSDVAAKVGETTTLLATLRPKEGFKILHGYNNRVGPALRV